MPPSSVVKVPPTRIAQEEKIRSLKDAPPADIKRCQSSQSFMSADDEFVKELLPSDEDESSPYTLEELQKEFKERDKLLETLVDGIHPTYAHQMRRNEAAARKEKLQRLSNQLEKKERQNDKFDDMKSNDNVMRGFHDDGCVGFVRRTCLSVALV